MSFTAHLKFEYLNKWLTTKKNTCWLQFNWFAFSVLITEWMTSCYWLHTTQLIWSQWYRVSCKVAVAVLLKKVETRWDRVCSIQPCMGSGTVVGVSSTSMSTIKSASTFYQSLTKIHKVKNFKNAPGTTAWAYSIFIFRWKELSCISAVRWVLGHW